MSAAIDHPRGPDGDEGRLRWERRGDDHPSEEPEQTGAHGDETARPCAAAQLGARRTGEVDGSVKRRIREAARRFTDSPLHRFTDSPMPAEPLCLQPPL